MPTVGILGAGAMGSGIAQVAISAGWSARLIDVNTETLDKAIEGIGKRLDRNVEKERMSAEDAASARQRLHASSINDLADCEVFIEAIVEDIDIKVSAILPLLEILPDEAIIASNTSSLSVSELGERIGAPERTCGMHFFNPAPIMKLVEVVRAKQTEQAILDRAVSIATSWGKKVARCADTPGFIVNRVARPYYLEAFRCLEDGLADPVAIDTAMKTIGGFRMGPFELTDFIGHDVNTATTRSVWEQWGRPDRLMPSQTQERLVSDGHLGRKTSCGVYDWSGDSPIAVLRPSQDGAPHTNELIQLADRFCQAATGNTDVPSKLNAAQQLSFLRILAAVLNEAAWAVEDGVAEKLDIDVAMKAGVNYPHGPFEWREAIGSDLVDEALVILSKTAEDDRFVPPA